MFSVQYLQWRFLLLCTLLGSLYILQHTCNASNEFANELANEKISGAKV